MQTRIDPRRLTWARPIALGMATASGSVGVLAVLLLMVGHDPVPALAALWEGSFGSAYALLSATLVRAIPLIFTGLAVAVAFRAGVWNIGAEGQLLAGAAGATAVGLGIGTELGVVSPVLTLTAGALAGAVLASIAGVLRARFGVLEIISTIMLNFATLHVIGFLVRGPLQEPTGIYPQSPSLPLESQLPMIVPGTRLHLGIVIAVAAAVALWATLRFTAVGFRIIAVGANATAAKNTGSIDVRATTLGAFLFSGALAGMAGAAEVTGVTFALYEGLSPGYGYTAIAVALLARLDPISVIFSAVLLGGLQAGGAAMQRDAAVPSVLVSIVEALLILAMAFSARRSRFLPPAPGSPQLVSPAAGAAG